MWAVSNVIHKKQNTTKVKMPKIYGHFLILVPPNLKKFRIMQCKYYLLWLYAKKNTLYKKNSIPFIGNRVLFLCSMLTNSDYTIPCTKHILTQKFHPRLAYLPFRIRLHQYSWNHFEPVPGWQVND